MEHKSRSSHSSLRKRKKHLKLQHPMLYQLQAVKGFSTVHSYRYMLSRQVSIMHMLMLCMSSL